MFVVTGCGHSGTLWAAVALARCGIPSTHEQAFPCDIDRPIRRLWNAGEVSWAAVPHARRLTVPVIRIVRDPFAVAASILRSRFLSDRPNRATTYVGHHRPDITDIADHVQRVVAYVCTWDLPVSDLPTVRVEDGPAALLEICRHTGRSIDPRLAEAVCGELGDNLHHHAGVDVHDLTGDPDLAARAAALGYGSVR